MDLGPLPRARLAEAKADMCPSPTQATAETRRRQAARLPPRAATDRGTHSSLMCSPCGKQVLWISVMLFELRSSTSKER